VKSIDKKSEELRLYDLIEDWTISYTGLKVDYLTRQLVAERFIFGGVMIGVS
jgi:hypothetical protein